VRLASNTPTTVQSRDAKRSVSPTPAPLETAGDRPADHLRSSRLEHASLDQLHLRAQHESAGVTPRITTFDGFLDSRFGRLMRTTGSFVMTSVRRGRLRYRAGFRRFALVDAALHFRLRAAVDHDDVVVLTRRDQRLLEAGGGISTVAKT
jgi:hypothetical protein